MALEVCLHQLQLRYIDIELHLLLDAWVSNAEGLHLGVAQDRLIHVFATSQRRPARHHLADELLFVLDGLVQVGIEGVFRDVPVDVNLRIPVPLPDDAPGALLQIRRTPGAV